MVGSVLFLRLNVRFLLSIDFFNHQAHSFVDDRRMTTFVTGDRLAEPELAVAGVLSGEVENWPVGKSLFYKFLREVKVAWRSEGRVMLSGRFCFPCHGRQE